jgi:hypothetical protein
MLSRFASAALVLALACTLGGTSALANTPPKADKSGPAATRPNTPAEAGKETKPARKLKTDMLKLVADAKAGKTATAAPRWQQPAMSNGLSKGQKIAIGVGIAVAVVVTIIVFKATCDGLCE